MKLLFTHFCLALSVMLLAAFGTPATAETWDIADDFSANSNPNGAWSYGYKIGNQGATFARFTANATVAAYYNTQQLAGWSDPSSDVVPYIAKNISQQDWGFINPNPGGGSFILHPGEVLLHPYSLLGNRFSVARWTAPYSGYYSLQAAFRRFQDRAGFNSSYAVLLNGAELSGGSGILFDFNLPNSSVVYSNSFLNLNTGDTLDFVVGIGNDGTSNNDGTTLSAAIDLITKTETVSGRITLQSAFYPVQPITFEFRPTNGSETFTRTVTLNQDRTYTLTGIPSGKYNVWIKGTRWLAKVIAVDVSNGSVTGVNAALKAGDANNDNSVDVFDLDLLIQAFDASEGDALYNQQADFNADGFVDILDLDLLILNFDRTGDD